VAEIIRSFEYDARGRPTRIVETGSTPMRIDFDYCGQ
jgi:YD repeat-containing protein